MEHLSFHVQFSQPPKSLLWDAAAVAASPAQPSIVETPQQKKSSQPYRLLHHRLPHPPPQNSSHFATTDAQQPAVALHPGPGSGRLSGESVASRSAPSYSARLSSAESGLAQPAANHRFQSVMQSIYFLCVLAIRRITPASLLARLSHGRRHRMVFEILFFVPKSRSPSGAFRRPS